MKPRPDYNEIKPRAGNKTNLLLPQNSTMYNPNSNELKNLKSHSRKHNHSIEMRTITVEKLTQ